MLTNLFTVFGNYNCKYVGVRTTAYLFTTVATEKNYLQYPS